MVKKPSLTDLALNEIAGTGPSCTVGKFLEGLEGDERTEAVALFARDSKQLPGAALARAVNTYMAGTDGWRKLSSETVQRHRRGQCSCG